MTKQTFWKQKFIQPIQTEFVLTFRQIHKIPAPPSAEWNSPNGTRPERRPSSFQPLSPCLNEKSAKRPGKKQSHQNFFQIFGLG